MSTRSKKEKREKAKKKRTSARQMAKEEAVGKSCLLLPDGVSFFKKKAGIVKMNVLEYKAGKGNPKAEKGTYTHKRKYWCHYNVGPNKDVVVCLAGTFNKKCPICEHRAKLERSSETYEDLTKSLKPKQKECFLINDTEAKRGEEIQVYDDSFANFGEVLTAELNAEEEDSDVDSFASHDDDGKTLRVSFIDDSFDGNKYVRANSIKFLERKEGIPDEVKERAEELCLDDMLQVHDYDTIKEKFMARDDDDSELEDSELEDSDVEESEVEDSDVEDSDVDSDTDEDEDEKKSSKKKKKSKEDDDEDDDEDDSEVEEAEKGDTVKGVYKGKTFKGKVKKVKNGLAHIATTDGDTRIMNLDELEVLKKGKEEDEEEEEQDREERKSSKKDKKAKSKKDEDEDDDEGEEDDSDVDSDTDEEEEEEKPKKKGKKEKSKNSGSSSKKASKKDDDDDDEDEDEDDED